MKIGEVAERTGVSESIIRYYERKGVLPRPRRDAAGYRDYSDIDFARIQLVTGARRLGCSLAEIKSIIALQDRQHVPSMQILELLSHKVNEVGREMDRLKEIRAALSRLHRLGLQMTEGAGVSTD
jgi:DNA-binding transcriptional MerR regulator